MGIGLSREEKQEYTDAEVLKNYFGLTVEIRDTNEKQADGKHPRRSDYVIGLAETDGFPLWSMSVEAGTNADLYYPTENANRNAVDRWVRRKAADQAGLVVIDMGQNKYLQASYNGWLADSSSPGGPTTWDAVDYMMNPNRLVTIPKRIIVIDKGSVVYDTYYNGGPQWGPTSPTVD